MKMTEPMRSANDLEWTLLNQQRMERAVARNWAGYRNATLEMAEFLKKETKLESALSMYLELCFIDLNGPQNPGSNPDLGVPNFDPSLTFGLAPGIVKRIKILVKKLGYDEAKTRERFFVVAPLIQQSIRLPVTPDEAWKVIRMELFKD